MIRRQERMAIQVVLVACAMLLMPMRAHTQDTLHNTTYAAQQDNGRGFNWGWLGLLGLLGLLPRKRKDTVVTETRPGGSTGTPGRY
jgi:hypothetical protein